MPTSKVTAQCNCTDYLYVNDPSLDITHKFTINTDGTIGAEVGNPWLANNVITNAHGVVPDPEGNLYISQIDTDPTTLYKVNCEGNVESSNYIPSWNRTLNMTTIDGTLYSIGRDPSGGPYHIYSYDLCTASPIDSIQLPDNGIPGWGLTTGLDGNLYFTQTFGTNTTYDHQLFTVASDLSSSTLISSIPNIPGYTTYGVTQDEFGNFYVVTTDIANTATVIHKIDPSGMVIQTISDTTLDQVGFGGAWGIRYNELTGKLYVGTLGEDCVAVIDAGGQSGPMTYQVGDGVGYVPGTYSKAVNILRECCPTPANITIDSIYCVAIGDEIDLRDFFTCNDGIVCSASWEEDPGNNNLTLDNCSQTVFVVGDNACGTFTLANANSTQCGAYSVTVNIESANITAPVIGSNQSICSGEDPQSFTLITPATATNGISYQWQSSTIDCSSGFMDIPGATNGTYDVLAGISQTTHYRLVASTAGTCASGTCTIESNCVTINVSPSPTSSSSFSPTTCFDGSDGTTTIAVVGGTAPYTYLWSNSQTTATATNLATGTYTVTATDANGCSTVESITVSSNSTGVPCFNVGISRN